MQVIHTLDGDLPAVHVGMHVFIVDGGLATTAMSLGAHGIRDISPVDTTDRIIVSDQTLRQARKGLDGQRRIGFLQYMLGDPSPFI